ncbi:MAG: hypothetical protein OXH84_07320 [Gammaproteobacteria bacterium]|nr:hypothetical protein [Gammaproteobacteria bacterium]
MKKWSEKQRTHNLRHALKLNERRLRSKRQRKKTRKSHERKPRFRRRLESPRTERITCPEQLSLEHDRTGVIDVVRHIRYVSSVPSKNPYIDFRKIQTVSLSGALILVAELDRWNKLKRSDEDRLNTIDVHEWNSKIRYSLGQMGFFQLLKANYPRDLQMADKAEHFDSFQYVKYRTDSKLDGQAIEEFRRNQLEPVLGTIPSPKHFYGALIEAMTNVDYHAYGDKVHYPNWWLSAAIDKTTKETRIMLFDQGAGIPKTIPKNFVDAFVSVFGNNHAKLIEAAHTLGLSASKKKNRGIGLQRDVKNYWDIMKKDGSYSVQSLKGEYTLEKMCGVVTETRVENHQSELPGTLIEWRIKR